ncbi:MAG TPA: PepSY domain-containing protein [Noviherbaspirillum sp.]
MSLHRHRITAWGLAIGLAIGGAQTGWASGPDDHDRARQALEAGEVLPLKSVLERVEQDYPGQVMEVELERENGRWLYEIKILRRGGSLLKLKVDARDGTPIGKKERHNAERRPSGEKP